MAPNKSSENSAGSQITLPADALLSGDKPPVLPGDKGGIEKGSATNSSDIEMQSSGMQMPENNDPVSGFGESLPETPQAPQTGAPSSALEKTGNDDISFQLPENAIQKNKSASVLRHPHSVVVEKGDTLFGIVSRFFSGNKADGVK